MLVSRRLPLLWLLFGGAAQAAAPSVPAGFVALPQGIVVPADQVDLENDVDWGPYAPDYRWGDDAVVDLQEKPLLFLTHHSTVYDPPGVAAAGARAAMDAFLAAGDPVFYLYSFRFAASDTFQFLDDYFARFTAVESEGGENKLRYRGGRAFFFTGGHFSMCLCETIRDTLRGVTDASMTEATHFYFVEDGIYDVGQTLAAHAAAYRGRGDGQAELVRDRLVSQAGDTPFFCTQNWRAQPELPLDDYTIDVIDVDGRAVALAHGDHGRFVFHLVPAADVPALIGAP
jgi:hypothetical protein